MHSGSTGFHFRSPQPVIANPEAAPEAARAKAIARLKKKARSVQPRVEQQYRSLLPFAAEADLVLAVENREGILELPLDREMLSFLEKFPEESVAYWHDTGHAAIKEGLGLLNHNEHLTSLADRLEGFHLHDVNESGRDHQPIGSGAIDFRMIASHIRPHHTLVLELSPRLSREEIFSSRETLLDRIA